MKQPLASCLAALVSALAIGCARPVAEESSPTDGPPLDVQAVRAFSNLKFARPLLLTHAGDGTNRVFVGSQLGKIYVFPNRQDVEEATVFLDLEPKVTYQDSQNEEGLLGLAFHPRYRDNGELFVFYSTREKPHTSILSRFRVSRDDPNYVDPASEEELFRLSKPWSNHNGGTIVFGPDGYLYIALGDGGSAKDPMDNGQNLKTVLGKILRIDVDHKDPGLAYAIPADNPFVSTLDARGEIWAYGLRNVWRMAFDRQTGQLWAGDVGQDKWEEINLIKKGGNYGWSLHEGFHPFKLQTPRADLIDPIFEYSHRVGKSITGGNVYRGQRAPQLNGAYLYADYVTGKLWSLWYDEVTKQVTANRPIGGNAMPVLSFGEDEQGETYFLVDTGTIHWFGPAAKD